MNKAGDYHGNHRCPSPRSGGGAASAIDGSDGDDSLDDKVPADAADETAVEPIIPLTDRGTDGDDAETLSDGRDTYDGGLGNDSIDGGAGTDTLSIAVSASAAAPLAQIATTNVEAVKVYNNSGALATVQGDLMSGVTDVYVVGGNGAVTVDNLSSTDCASARQCPSSLTHPRRCATYVHVRI